MHITPLLRQAALSALLLLTPALPSAAREVTAGERAALVETIATFDAAMRANDMELVILSLPPKVLESMAAQFSVAVDEFVRVMAMQMKDARGGVLFVSYGMDVNAATYAELADGTPYAVIPTESVAQYPGRGKFKTVSSTLGLIEDGHWYLLRISDGQLRLLRSLYPGFADVAFPPGTMEPVG